MVNKPFCISPNEVLQFWLIKTAYRLLLNNNKGNGRGGLLERGSLIGDLRYVKSKLGRQYTILENLNKDVFERRSSTGSGLFSFLGSDFAQSFGQIVFMRL